MGRSGEGGGGIKFAVRIINASSSVGFGCSSCVVCLPVIKYSTNDAENDFIKTLLHYH